MKTVQHRHVAVLLGLVGAAFWLSHNGQNAYSLHAQSTKVNTSAIDCDYSHEVPSPSLLAGTFSKVQMRCSSKERTMTSNGIPNHEAGPFPNRGNPHSITAQSIHFDMPLNPQLGSLTGRVTNIPGYARNGIKLEPETAEVYANGREGWRYEAIQNPVLYSLGLDQNLAHVQPNGEYHYHGIPDGYFNKLLQGGAPAMVLMAWASDGFPIYARYGYTNPADSSSAIKIVKPNYRLKNAQELAATQVNGQARPGFNESEVRRGNKVVPSLPLGIFVQDWIFDASLGGDLDECNGRFGVTPEFPQGIYHYYLTDAYPYMQRCIKGEGKLLRLTGGPPGGGFGGPGGGPGGPGGRFGAPF